MPKYYLQSGRVRLIFDAADAEQAAVKALQWTCDKQKRLSHAATYKTFTTKIVMSSMIFRVPTKSLAV
jgi:hypothetical protein